MSRQTRQQSRQRGCVAASGFALSPIRATFLGSHRWVSNRRRSTSDVVSSPSIPTLLCRYARRGDGQSDRGRLRSAQRLFCVQNSASTKKKGPDVNVEAKGARLFWPTILGWGRTVITLLDTGGSETTVRRCRD